MKTLKVVLTEAAARKAGTILTNIHDSVARGEKQKFSEEVNDTLVVLSGKLLFNKATTEPSCLNREEYKAMPRASFAEIDQYMTTARNFLAATGLYSEVANITAEAIAAYLAACDGKRLRV